MTFCVTHAFRNVYQRQLCVLFAIYVWLLSFFGKPYFSSRHSLLFFFFFKLKTKGYLKLGSLS